MKTLMAGSNEMANVVPARSGEVRDWPLGALRGSGLVATLRRFGALLGGEWRRIPLHRRNRV